MQNETAISMLRAFNGYNSQNEGFFASLLRKHLDDKAISVDTIRFMVSQKIPVGSLIHGTLFRGKGNLSVNDMNFLVKMIYADGGSLSDLDVNDYDGSADQNKVIDRSLTLYNAEGFFVGESAMAQFSAVKNVVANADYEVKNISIAIIGTGPAGVMMASALRLAGFGNISHFDKAGSALGIWGQPNVSKGTKNNPRNLDFNGQATLNAARGDGTRDGDSVVNFIRTIGERAEIYHGSEKRPVTKIDIGDDFSYNLHYDEGKQASFNAFPIVINCMGTGKPREFNSDPSRMTHNKGDSRAVAVRWQQRLERGDVQGKRFAFIGLGNSTAEMISQLNEFRNAGVECDYKIFTHYPEDSVFNPNDTVDDGRLYRMFRDLSKPDLTGFQGDLPRARQDYMRSLREKRIVADVGSWSLRKSLQDTLVTDQEEYAFDKLFVLTGYQQDTKELEEKFGLDCSEGYPASDFDGEFRDAGELRKGYFGLGALMDSPHDPNAVVIPGMMFRIPDILFTVTCRAAEYVATQQSKE